MKRILSLCLVLLVLFSAGACAEEIILNKTRGDHADFAFAQDAKLLEVYFPQIFGCDAALVRYGDHTMLIDCAGNQWKQTKALLDKLGVTSLTYALNSHPDADHIGGFNRVLKDIPAGEFLLGFPEDHDSGDEVRFQVYEDLHAMGIPLRRVSHGETIEFGDVSITVYQRTDEHLPRVNNKSVMLMIQYGERRIFFTGDIQSHTQKILGENAEGLDLSSDILKFPHHGYDRMQESFLAQVSPELVICTCGDSKTEGIKQLKEHNISYQMTANQMLRLATDGKVWTVEKFK
ncbi:MAG: MBL fold metallo-hydrolase [Clostridia bacterium]|nr:MBL fold metallo-hydrolase [Clostridia bacterium]